MKNKLDIDEDVLQAASARQVLNWQPARFDLATIIEDAWTWEEKAALQPSYA